MKARIAFLSALLVAAGALAASGNSTAGDKFDAITGGVTGLKLKSLDQAPAPVVRRHLPCQVVAAGVFQALTGGPTILPGVYFVTNTFEMTIPSGTTFTIRASGRTHTFTSAKAVNHGEKIGWPNTWDLSVVPCDATVPF